MSALLRSPVAEALEASGRRHLVASPIEHEAVLNTFKALARRGWTTTLLPVDASGVVAPAALEAALTEKTALVSVMHANNEIGTIQPIAELARIAHARGALFHTDAVQSVAKIPVVRRALAHCGSSVARASARFSPAANTSAIDARAPRTSPALPALARRPYWRPAS